MPAFLCKLAAYVVALMNKPDGRTRVRSHGAQYRVEHAAKEGIYDGKVGAAGPAQVRLFCGCQLVAVASRGAGKVRGARRAGLLCLLGVPHISRAPTWLRAVLQCLPTRKAHVPVWHGGCALP